ncbi:MAG: TetR/AcrR family transcriptional regulator [Fibrobacterota bacterium]
METKDKIRKHAMRLFAMKGYRETSVNIIVGTAGITKGGFYYFYKSKEELFNDCVETYFFSFMDDMFKPLDDPEIETRDKLYLIKELFTAGSRELAEKFAETKISFRFYYTMLFEGLKNNDHVKKRAADSYRLASQKISSVLQKAADEEIIRKDTDIKTVSWELIISVEGAMLIYMLDETLPVWELIDAIVNRIFKTIIIEK